MSVFSTPSVSLTVGNRSLVMLMHRSLTEKNLRFGDVDDAGIGNTLHVAGVARDGVIWRTIRLFNGAWQSAFGDVNNQESNSGLRFTSVGASGSL